MGIGYALASGLVQGFTQNIGREMERRKAEKDRLTTYKAALTEALLKDPDDVNAAGIEALQGMVKRAEGQLDEREAINIFGTRGADIDLDMDNDFDEVIASINNAQKGVAVPIGTYSLRVDERYSDVLEKPLASANLRLQALNREIATPEGRTAFEQNFDISTVEGLNNFNQLRTLVKADFDTVLRNQGPEKNQEGVPLAFSPKTSIQNYDYFVDFLNLSTDEDLLANIDAAKLTHITQFQNGGGSIELTPQSVFALHGPSMTGTQQGDYQFVTREDLVYKMGAENFSNLEGLASYQGRSLDLILYDYSQQFDGINNFYDGLKHMSAIYGIAGEGTTLNIAGNAEAVGAYLDSNVRDPAQQMKVIGGVMGSILTPYEKQSIDLGLRTEDFYKVGTSISTGYDATFGAGSYKGFQERINAGQRAKEKLQIYRGYVEGIPTVKGTMLDGFVKAVDGFLGETGTVDQIVQLMGPMDEDTRAKIETRLENVKATGGNRARRDTLAFIIAADMARAEDTAGRLSDGDLQRNLEKLSSTSSKKGSELAAIDTVIQDMNMLVSSLSDINLMINEQGSRGFGVELQTRIRNLNMRDTVMDFYRNNQTGGGAFNYDSLLTNADFSVYMPDQLPNIGLQAKNPAHGIVMSNDGEKVIVIDTAEKRIVDSGSVQEMNKYVIDIPSGETPVVPTSEPQSAASSSEEPAAAADSSETAAAPTPEPAPEVEATGPKTISSLRVNLDKLTAVSPSAQYPDGGFNIAGEGDAVFEKVVRDNGEVDYVQLTPIQTGN